MEVPKGSSGSTSRWHGNLGSGYGVFSAFLVFPRVNSTMLSVRCDLLQSALVLHRDLISSFRRELASIGVYINLFMRYGITMPVQQGRNYCGALFTGVQSIHNMQYGPYRLAVLSGYVVFHQREIPASLIGCRLKGLRHSHNTLVVKHTQHSSPFNLERALARGNSSGAGIGSGSRSPILWGKKS